MKKVLGKILLILILLVLIALVAAAIIFDSMYGDDIRTLRSRASLIAAGSSRDDFREQETSVCYYSDGSVMQTLKNGKDVYYLPYRSIPETAVKAVLAIEDRKFFEHGGYDLYAIIRAGVAYIRHEGEIKQGGSTITQQLARMMYLTPEKKVERKILEIFLAVELEKKFSKEDILEFYLNNIYFANGYYGLQAAAKGYFDKAACDLTLSEAALLCGIPNSPSNYDPRKNPDKALERRNSVLSQMRDVGVITEEEYRQAVSEEPVYKSSQTERHNYEETYTYECATRALMKAEGFEFIYSFETREEEDEYNEYYDEMYSTMRHRLSLNGYRIYTSINPEKQQLLQEAADKELEEFTEVNGEGIYSFQTAAVSIDNDTGFVVAIIGGRSQEYNGYTLNRAYQSPRQPGSSIKPLIVYTPWFERGLYPDDRVIDEYTEGGPHNAGDTYSGEIDIRYAISVSKNTIAWDLFGKLGIDTGLHYLERLRFEHICENDRYPAASLGGLTYGVTAVEMTSAYAAIENDGVFRTPTCIERITDAEGNVITDNVTKSEKDKRSVDEYRVYEANASRIMTDTLTTVMESGTARKIAPEGMSCAGKTGTSTGSRDGWFIGFTRYYTTGVWVGYDMPRIIDDLSGGGPQGRIWQAYMTQIHEGLPDKEFEWYVDDRGEDEKGLLIEAADGMIVPVRTEEAQVQAAEPEQEDAPIPEDDPWLFGDGGNFYTDSEAAEREKETAGAETEEAGSNESQIPAGFTAQDGSGTLNKKDHGDGDDNEEIWSHENIWDTF